MLVKQLIRETLELQGFRIESVEKKDSGLLVTIQADLRYLPRCGVCGTSEDYRVIIDKQNSFHSTTSPLFRGITSFNVVPFSGLTTISRLPWQLLARSFIPIMP